jgi:superfamily II DNA or RNA helicase
MEITLSNRIRVKNAPDVIQQLLTDKLRIPNPKFIEAQAAGRSVYDLEQYITNFSVMPDGSLLIPRGLRSWLINQCASTGIAFSIIDKRFLSSYEVIYSPITYRPYQSKAITSLITKSSEGVLVAPAGSGKTVMGLSLIPIVGQPTLWLTHTGPLADQAIERARSFLPNINEIGLIGRGKWTKGDLLTVGMVQTLARNPDKLVQMRDDYGLVILDECLPAGTNILMLDGSVKDIVDVNNGDVTTFGKVSNKFERQTDILVELRGSWGKLPGTPTHRLPIIKKENLTKNKHTNTLNPPCEGDIVMTTMSEINRGDMVLVAESNCHIQRHELGVPMARLLALVACDGHIEKNYRCLQIGIVKDKEWFLSEMIEISASLQDSDLRIHDCQRGDLIIRQYSKQAINFLKPYVPAGKKHTLNVPALIEHTSLKDIRNYLQVVFDTEGGLNRNQITITMSTPEFLIDIQHLLKKFGIMSRVIPIKKRGTRKNYLRLAMAGYDAFLFYLKIGFSMGRKQEELKNIVQRANKFVRRVRYKGVVYRCVDVLSVRSIHQPITVYDFTTEGHMFMANGVLSSNCHHCPASTFLNVVSQLNSFYMYGLTATPYRRDKLEMLMFQYLGMDTTVIPVNEVEAYGGIIVPTVRIRKVFGPVVKTDNIQQILKEHVVNNAHRNSMIISDVLAEARNNKFCIVISDRRAHCEMLHKAIKRYWPKTGIVTGKYTKKQITKQVELFNNEEITVLVATFSLLGEGFDVPFLDRAFISMPFRAEAKAEQLLGRIQRSHPGKEDAVVYDYVDENIGVIKNQFFNQRRDCRYRTYTRLGAKIEVD